MEARYGVEIGVPKYPKVGVYVVRGCSFWGWEGEGGG